MGTGLQLPITKKLLHIHVLFFILAEAQQLERFETEDVGDDEFGKLFDSPDARGGQQVTLV